METFTEFRKDGWPLCPQCGEDELYSVYLFMPHGIDRQAKGEQIELDELLRYPFRCYYCGWRNDRDPVLLAALIETVCAKD